MNTRSLYPGLIRHLGIVTAGLCLLGCATTASGVGKTNPPTATSQSTTNAGSKLAPIEIPLSQFTIPTAIAEGRNPFFPDSTATLKVNPKPTDPAGRPMPVALVLQGIAGTGGRRFALINGRTFEVGEDGDVTVGRSKVHVRCLNIREDGVTIEIEGNRQELKMRPGL